MVCVNCAVAKETFQLSMLSNDSEYRRCAECNDIKNMIDIFQSNSHLIYNMELRRKFFGIYPLYTGNEIVMMKPELFNVVGFDEDQVFKDLFENMNIFDTKYSTHMEINNICDQIMAQLIHQLNYYIGKNPQGYLVSLIGVLEYNFHVTGACVLWSGNYTSDKFIEEVTDNFSRDMLRSLEWQRKYDFSELYKSLYKEWEGQLSLDKYALQYAIELIHHSSKKLFSQNEPFNAHIFGNIFSIIRAIYKLIQDRETSIENVKKGESLLIDKTGRMYTTYSIDHDKFAKLYLESMGHKLKKEISLDAKNIFDEKCLEHLGVTLYEISEAAFKLSSIFKQGDEFLVGSKKYFEILFMQIFNRSQVEVVKLIDYLLNTGDGFEYAYSTKVRKNKVLNHCLLQLENGVMCCPVQFLALSLNTLYIDIVEGNLPEGPLKRELFKATHKSQNIEFENQVSKMLADFFPEAILKVGIPKDKGIPILNTENFISFYGEIDILFYYSKTLFLIECKNKSLKTSVKALSNDLNSFTKKGKDSFQYKIDKKINDVYENWTSVLAYLKVPNYKSIPPKKPIGVFVTSSLTLATLEDLPIPVIPASHIISWINENLSS
ncbi:hypothetical protein [Paenibacillus sp. 7516]|uniref:hypothetical protein n=1 Tax=Paenibacillus sp. 7516 TaxID=2022549 RepID=UPI000BA7D336|nr:hypothetical protein [Paenibacillus sp. 7516]PAF30890.1 hypothetical protein CHI14_15320 [Paenibacillus sp. 7516]